MDNAVVDFIEFRRQAKADRQRRREEAFDRELRRRLDLFLAGQPIPSEPIADNPYLPDP